MKQVIVVGSGGWGKNLVRNFHELGALAGVAELNPDLQTKVKTDYPDVELFADFHEALNLGHAFVFATPAPTHYRFAKEALEAGKDVFIEKPMTLSTADAQALADYAKESGNILMVGHLLLYQPAIAWMRDYIQQGELGTVHHVATQRAKLGRVRSQENVWWSFAPHDISVVLDLLGNPSLTGVQAQGHAMLQANIQDDVHVNLTFASGQTAHIHSSWYWPLNQRSTTVIGSKRMMVYDEVAQTVTVHDKGIHDDLSNRDNGAFTADIADSQPLKLECQHFLECLETRQPPRSDGYNGVAVVEVLEKVDIAMKGQA